MGVGAVEEVCREGPGVGRTTRKVVVPTSRYFGLRCAGLAGSKRCAEWIVGHAVSRRNNTKECLTVLKGLCAGGHLEVAQELVDGKSSCFRSLRWTPNAPDMLYYIRELSANCKSLLFEACEGGSLETVKWVMSKFRVGTEDWELIRPFQCAVRRGHVDTVKWLASTTGVVAACQRSCTVKNLQKTDFILSSNVEVVRMCTTWFPGKRKDVLTREILCSFMESASQKNDTDFQAGCEWIMPKLLVEQAGHLLLHLTSPRGVKWLMSKDPGLTPSMCTFKIADKELLRWMTTKFPVTPHFFICSCGNENDSVEMMQTVLGMTTKSLTLNHLREGLGQALSVNNISIAEWLDSTFHLVSSMKSGKTTSLFVQICKGQNCSRGLQWFLTHVQVQHISENFVHRAVALNLHQFHELSVLLNTFPVAFKEFEIHLIKCATESWSLMQTIDIVSRCAFLTEHICQGLLDSKSVQSGKVDHFTQFVLDSPLHIAVSMQTLGLTMGEVTMEMEMERRTENEGTTKKPGTKKIDEGGVREAERQQGTAAPYVVTGELACKVMKTVHLRHTVMYVDPSIMRSTLEDARRALEGLFQIAYPAASSQATLTTVTKFCTLCWAVAGALQAIYFQYKEPLEEFVKLQEAVVASCTTTTT
ncbi:hypothetical protein Pelo_16343 [Pelomyxa schiedti]|nr:hypothetical protein Pelo_16343 [Pelomyxa schiedti]